MRFCSQCGRPVALRIPAGESLPRHVCDACGTIHYQNPKLIAGCVVESADHRLLLCRRAIEPRLGRWTVPAGFMELGETSEDAARRETHEEAEAEVAGLALHCVIDVPHVSQVHVIYRGVLVADRFGPGAETLEARLFAVTDLPWQDLAFRSVRVALELFIADRAHGHHEVHRVTVAPQ